MLHRITSQLLVLILLTSCTEPESISKETIQAKKWAIAIHGGSGGITPERLNDEAQAAYRSSLDRALSIGEDKLAAGAAGLDVIEVVVAFLENDSLFNAGRGAVLTDEGHCELDASLMDGKTLNCGAVTGIQNIKNPILAARLVMDSSEHVFFSGKGATEFALDHGLEEVDSTYFITSRRLNRYKKSKGIAMSDHPKEWKYGTVGCVALDSYGNLAAGTSTGGTFRKRHGRIGDSPIIGAGNYADNRSCAVSCTGSGEYFIRSAVAHDMHSRMLYGDQSVEEAAAVIIDETLPDLGGDGGLIAVDKYGNIVMDFNTAGMFRACADSDGLRRINMFKEKESD